MGERQVGPRWNVGLEGPALGIASSTAQRLRVCAGPGTGKTTALMRRVARLLEEGVSPARILVVTFTRTAARDLLESLQKLGIEGCSKVQTRTLHSFCFNMLNTAAVLALTGRVPRPLLKFEVRFLEEDLKRPGRGIRKSRSFVKAFEAAWARLQVDEPGWPHTAEEQEFHQDLLAWLRFHGAMLIGEMVTETRIYLRNNPHCEERRAFDHIVVDEYQDLNRADQDLIDLLSENSSLIVIGDEDQAIYSRLRFAQPESIRPFISRHPGTEDQPLSTCHRCPTRIVDIANFLISNNQQRESRQLVPKLENPEGEVDIVQWLSLEEEAVGLAAMIEGRIKSGQFTRNEILVLAPRRVVGYAIRQELNRRGVEAHSYFSEEALDTELARQQFTLLTLLVRPNDRVALRCWLGFGQANMGAAPYHRVQAYCDENSRPPWEAMQSLQREELRIPYTADMIDRFRLLETALGSLSGLKGQDLVDALFPEGDEDLDSVRSMACAALVQLGPETEPSDLLEDLLTRIIQPELPPEGDFVRIMSLQKSKGLTAQFVVVASCVEGWIPTLHKDTDTDPERDLEEQRRLFYVALTRARKALILSSFSAMPINVAHRMQVQFARKTGNRASVIASRFFSELGQSAPQPRAVHASSIDGQ